MPRKVKVFTEIAFDKIAFIDSTRGQYNSVYRDKMKLLLSRVMANELTSLQLLCVTEYYLKEKKMKDIAFELGLNPSTVTRHIQKAKKKIKNIAQYY